MVLFLRVTEKVSGTSLVVQDWSRRYAPYLPRNLSVTEIKSMNRGQIFFTAISLVFLLLGAAGCAKGAPPDEEGRTSDGGVDRVMVIVFDPTIFEAGERAKLNDLLGKFR